MDHNKIYALGFFDGVHLGHQALLAECVRMAAAVDAIPAAITFDRHPRSLFTEFPPALLSSNADRDRLLRQFGMKYIHSLAVNQEVMSTRWQDFLQQLLDAGAAGFVCGDDFRFGHNGEGNAEKLDHFCGERSLPCVIVPGQKLGNVRISSTHIRGLIERGDLQEAVRFLGHPHVLSGRVVPGRQLGRTIGVPTANIELPKGIIVPKCGVYACNAHVNGHIYPAVTNIGSRPTVNGHQVRAESWILGFEGDLYGKTVMLEFHKFLRPEQKFDSLEELKNQIHRDAAEAYKLLR